MVSKMKYRNKSNSEEAIGLLWLLLATQTQGFVQGFAQVMGVFSLMAAAYYAVIGRKVRLDGK